MLTQHPATSIDDLRTATDLMSAAWRAGSPHVAQTPASIEWWYALTHPDPLGEHLRLWRDGSTPVAWSWHEPPELECHVWTGDAERDVAVFGTIVRTTLVEAGDAEVASFAADDDRAAIELFRSLGMAPAGHQLSRWQWRPEEGDRPALAPLPDGYLVRGLRDPAEFAGRVALHRAAFPPSRLTVEKYERLLTVQHYRLENDLVVEGPHGELAAFALGWLDADGGVAEFEPVGTHPGHQRRGLARALLTAGVARFQAAGARVVQVYADASDRPAESLYRAIGFRRRTFHQRYVRGGPRPPIATDATIDA